RGAPRAQPIGGVIELAPAEIAAACDARLLAGDEESGAADRARRAVIDSRDAGNGDLFFGIAGEHADGGEFAEAAIEAGAWGVVVAEPHASRAAAKADDARVFAVKDPVAALGALAARRLQVLRSRGCRVVGITGSTGKTSTKDILVSMLRPVAPGRV